MTLIPDASRKGFRHHRKPPMAEGVPYQNCPWCGIAVVRGPKPRKTWPRWHPACIKAFKLATRASSQRAAIRKRGDAGCAGCGSVGPWQADHIIPLWAVPPNVSLAEREVYWGLGNLQRLCVPCHKEKSALEAGQRAKAKRESESKP